MLTVLVNYIFFEYWILICQIRRLIVYLLLSSLATYCNNLILFYLWPFKNIAPLLPLYLCLNILASVFVFLVRQGHKFLNILFLFSKFSLKLPVVSACNHIRMIISPPNYISEIYCLPGFYFMHSLSHTVVSFPYYYFLDFYLLVKFKMVYHQRFLCIIIKLVFIEGNYEKKCLLAIFFIFLWVLLWGERNQSCVPPLGWKVTLKSEMRNITLRRKVLWKQTEIAIQTYVARKFGLSAN